MNTDTVPGFVETLADSRVLSPEQLDEVQGALLNDYPDPQALANELVRRGWLTIYQVKQLFAGRGPELLVGQYVLLQPLGEGGMGQVFKAWHPVLEQVRALKVIRPDRLASDNAVRRFYREIKAVARLAHPNIIHAYDAGQAGDRHYFVMEFVEGADLSHFLKQQGRLPVAQACDYVRQAALGLQHAHERGMVHRDVKPSNLLLTQSPGRGSNAFLGGPDDNSYPFGVIKLLDMGLALLKSRDESPDNLTAVTDAGMVMGTPDYMSPEQGSDSHQVDVRSDLYSLGCTLFHLLTGEVPYPGGSFMDKLIKHRMDPVPRLEEKLSDAPEAVCAVVARLLAKKPEERFQTPAELAAALEGLCGPDAAGGPAHDRATLDTYVDVKPGAAKADGGTDLPRGTERGPASVEAPWSEPNWSELKSKGGERPSDWSATPRLPEAPAGDNESSPTPAPPAPRRSSLLTPSLALLGAGCLVGLAWVALGLPVPGRRPPVAQVGIEERPTAREAPNQPDPPSRRETPPPPAEKVGTPAPPKAPEKMVPTVVYTVDRQRDTVYPLTPPPEFAVVCRVDAPNVAADKKRVAVSPDGRFVVFAVANVCHLFDVTDVSAEGRPLRVYRHHAGDSGESLLRALAVGGDGPRVVFGGTLRHLAGGGQLGAVHNVVGLWQMEDEARHFVGSQVRWTGRPADLVSDVQGLALSPSGRYVLACHRDANRSVTFWDLDDETARRCRYLKDHDLGHLLPATCAAFAPDDNRALTGGADNAVCLWDLGPPTLYRNPEKVLRRMKGHEGPVAAVTFGRDGRRALSGGYDGARLWDLNDGKELRRLRPSGLPSPVLCVALSADGKQALTGGEDGFVRLWDVESGRQAAFKQHKGAVKAVAFTPDGKFGLSGGDDNTVCRWRLP